MNETSYLLDEHDNRELDELLAALKNEDALHLDGAQGLLTAVAIGPVEIGPQQWLPKILGEQPTLTFEHDAQRLIELLFKLDRAVRYGLDSYAFDPIFSEHEDEQGDSQVEVGGWCEGFSIGVDLAGDAWADAISTYPELLDLLHPVMALGVDDGVFAEIADPDLGNLSEREREELIHLIAGALIEVKEFFAHQPRGTDDGPVLH